MALTNAQKRNAEKNRRYWAEREAEALKHYITEEKEYDKEIRRIHQNMLDACQKEIESFYAKYASAEGISLAEAKKRVSKLDIEAYERKAAKYVKEKNFSKKANGEMRLYNATMKINRLEMLKANIGLETIAGHDELEKFMAEILKGRTMDELARQAGILGKTVRNNAAKAHAIVNGSFHSGTFSDRIWQYQDLMRQDLGKLLQQGLIQGKGARALTKDLRKYLIGENMAKMGGATYCVERLMRTELARVQTEAQKQSFIRNGFDHYEFIVNSGCCAICQGLSGKHFRVDKMMPGENAPPLHPHCRCSTAAWEDDAEYEAWLDYLKNGGTTAEWNKLKANSNTTESGLLGSGVNRIGTNDVNLDYIKSPTFRNKFGKITNNTAINDTLRKYADAMLTHRKGTDAEDLYIIHAETGKLLYRNITGVEKFGVSVPDDVIENLRKQYSSKMIAIHNHPTNIPPTGSDYSTAGYRGYQFGVVVTHSGRVFTYKAGDKPFYHELLDKRVDKYTQSPYNLSIEKAHEKVLDEFVEEYGILWKEIN